MKQRTWIIKCFFIAGIPCGTALADMHPSQVANLSTWLRADVGVTLGAGGVANWIDSSGNGHNYTQGSSSARPQRIANELNGLPVVRFDGVNDGLTAGGQLITGNSFTIFTVMSYKPGGAFWHWQVGGPNVNGRVFFEDSDFGGNNVNSIDIGHDNSHDARAFLPGIGDTSFKTMAIVGDQDLLGTRVFVDGVAATMALTGANLAWGGFGARQNRLGQFDVPTAFSNVDFAEFIIYDRALNASERQGIEAYLDQKYFQPIPAPSAVMLGSIGLLMATCLKRRM